MNRLDKLFRKVRMAGQKAYTAIIWPIESGARLEMELPDTRIDCRFQSVEAAKKEANDLAVRYKIDEDQLLLITVDYGEGINDG